MEYMLTFHILNVYVDKTQPHQFKFTFKTIKVLILLIIIICSSREHLYPGVVPASGGRGKGSVYLVPGRSPGRRSLCRVEECGHACRHLHLPAHVSFHRLDSYTEYNNTYKIKKQNITEHNIT